MPIVFNDVSQPAVDQIELMTQLKKLHLSILTLIKTDSIVFLDIPVYGNIGDLLIMHGTLAFFEQHNISPKYIASALNFRNTVIGKQDTILFQGGGNLGDLYPVHQKFREKIVSEYKNNRIIILPQTIHFDSEQHYAECCDIFSTHSDLHLIVRDKPSYRLALKMTSNVYLLPDMAHQLFPIRCDAPDTQKILCLKRRDQERHEFMTSHRADLTTDWHALLHLHLFLIKCFAICLNGWSKIPGGLKTDMAAMNLWLHYSKYLISRAVRLFEPYSLIMTNRLHGHILASLMGKPNVLFDNRYGKNSAYANQWTGQSPLVREETDSIQTKEP